MSTQIIVRVTGKFVVVIRVIIEMQMQLGTLYQHQREHEHKR